jgi:hypothetical protein
MTRFLMIIGGALAAASAPAVAQRQPAPVLSPASQAYAPYEWLIGDWVTREQNMSIRQSFKWGPARSYIAYSTYTQPAGRPETLHFEGIMVWNGATRMLDYVFAIEPGSGGQEKGTVRAEPNGSIVREVELTTADGKIAQFRQTIWRSPDGQVATSLMRLTARGWEPNFPGSDKIVMTRRGE